MPPKDLPQLAGQEERTIYGQARTAFLSVATGGSHREARASTDGVTVPLRRVALIGRLVFSRLLGHALKPGFRSNSA